MPAADIQRHVQDRRPPATNDSALVVFGRKPSSTTDDTVVERLLLLRDQRGKLEQHAKLVRSRTLQSIDNIKGTAATAWHDMVQKEFAMLFDFVSSSVHNIVPALKLALGVALDELAMATELNNTTPLPFGKPNPAAEQKRFMSLLKPALDEYADGTIDSSQLDMRRAEARRLAAVRPSLLALHVTRIAYDADADGDIDEDDAKLGNVRASDVIETLKYDIGAARLADEELPLPPALQGVDPSCIVQVETLVHIAVKFGRQPYVFYVKTRKPCVAPLLGVDVRYYQADYTAHTWLVHNGKTVTKMYTAILEDKPFDLKCDIDVFLGTYRLPACLEPVEERIAVSLLRTLLKKTFDPHSPMEFIIDKNERPGPPSAPGSMEPMSPPGLCAGPRKGEANRIC